LSRHSGLQPRLTSFSLRAYRASSRAWTTTARSKRSLNFERL
jgi:hypothetical protein